MTKAPIFEINDSDGKPFKMEDHFPMVLYFYPLKSRNCRYRQPAISSL